jgi:hypothetical protein
MDNIFENQHNSATGAADHTPQNIRKTSATALRNYAPEDSVADWTMLPYIPDEAGEIVEYTPYIEVKSEPTPPAPSPVMKAVLKYTVPVIAGGAMLYGGGILIAWLVVQVRFWLAVGTWIIIAIVLNHLRNPPRRRTPMPDTPPPSGQTQNGHTIIINNNHSGNGNINNQINF